MYRYLIRRLMWAFVLFVAVTIVTYIIFYAVPANPAQLACGQRATPECIKRAAHYLGTDRPLYVQYRGIRGNGLDEWKQPGHEVVLRPARWKSGDLLHPYDQNRK